MNTKTFHGWFALVTVTGMISETSIVRAAGLSLSFSTADGGGGSCSGGVTPAGGTKFTMTGTIGQPDAGGSVAGTYVQQGGLIPAFTLPVAPALNMSRSGSLFAFTWPEFCQGFVLEAPSSPNGSVWTSFGSGMVVNGNRQVTVFSPTWIG